MIGSFFDDFFQGGPRTLLDNVFGQLWQINPQTRPSANSGAVLDISRPIIIGIIGIFADTTEIYKPLHAYDVQTSKRPGVVSAQASVEFADSYMSAPLDLRSDDVAVRMADVSQWRINSIRRDAVTNRLVCALGRLS